MSSKTEKCDHCGAKTVEYHHALSIPLILGLRRLYNAGGGPINLRELNMPWSMRDNFQKLRYFGLVEKTYSEGKRLNGVWHITPKGIDFIEGKSLCAAGVWTYRGQTERVDAELIHFKDVVGDYKQREEWAAEAVPHQSNA